MAREREKNTNLLFIYFIIILPFKLNAYTNSDHVIPMVCLTNGLQDAVRLFSNR